MAARTKPPAWFWIAAIAVALWGAMGIYAFYADVTMSAADVAKMSAYDQAFRAHQPRWSVWLYGVAVWSGLIGAILLLLRSRHAHPVFVVSLVAVVVLFGWVFVATDMIAVKGPVQAMAFPIFVAAVAVAQIRFADRSQRRGWIG